MHSPAAALAWEFWWRHRLGLAGVVVLIVGFAVVCAVNPMTITFASVSSIWFVMGLCYVIGVFAYGFEGHLERAESGFPVRLFVLPVRTCVLVGWPMLQGMALAVLLWLAWDRFVLWPCGVEIPAWWPPMLAAVVAVSQALVWLPFGLPWVRLPVMVAVLTVLIRSPAFLSLAGDQFAEPDTQDRLLSILAVVLVPVAFLVAWWGVGRARRGDTPDWLTALRAVRTVAGSWRERSPFASAMRSQVWCEWRLRGCGYLIFVVGTVFCFMAFALALEPNNQGRVGYYTTFLVMPILVAAFWGSYMGTTGESYRKVVEMSAFYATRPLSNAQLAAAKLRVAAWMALAGWGFAVAVAAGWLLYTDGFRAFVETWKRITWQQGIPRVGLGVLLVVGPPLVIWRMLVANLWSGLSGRAWVVAVQSVLGAMLGLQLMYEWLMWDVDVSRKEWIKGVLPWAAGAAAALKLLLAACAIRAVIRRGEVNAGTVGKLLAVWVLVVAVLFGLLVWVVPSQAIPPYGLALGIILFVPLTRLAIAPLALAWNRHR